MIFNYVGSLLAKCVIYLPYQTLTIALDCGITLNAYFVIFLNLLLFLFSAPHLMTPPYTQPSLENPGDHLRVFYMSHRGWLFRLGGRQACRPLNCYVTLGNLPHCASISSSIKHGNHTTHGGSTRINVIMQEGPVPLSETW